MVRINILKPLQDQLAELKAEKEKNKSEAKAKEEKEKAEAKKKLKKIRKKRLELNYREC